MEKSTKDTKTKEKKTKTTTTTKKKNKKELLHLDLEEMVTKAEKEVKSDEKKETKKIELKPVKSADEIIVKKKEKEKADEKLEQKITENKIKSTKKVKKIENVQISEKEYDEMLDGGEPTEEEVKKGYAVIKKRFKLESNRFLSVVSTIGKELLIPLALLVIMSATYILKDVFNSIIMNIITVVLSISSIVIYEKSYRQSSEGLFLKGLELNVITFVYILFANKLLQGFQTIQETIFYWSVFGIYYIIKCVVIYEMERKKQIQSMISVKELTKDNRRKYI